MQNRHTEAPQRASPEELEEEMGRKPPSPPFITGQKRMRGVGGFSSSGIMPFIATAIVVLLITYVFIVPQVAVTKSDFTTNLSGVATNIKTLQDSDKIMGPKIDAATNNIATFANSINAQKVQLDALVAQITDLKNQIAATNNNINNLQTSINNNFVAKSGLDAAIRGAVNTADLQKSIDADKATLTALNTQLANTNKSIADLKTALEARLVALETKTTSSTGISQTNLPFTCVISLIDEDNNTGSDNKSSSSIKVTLTNTTTKAIEDIGIEFIVMVDATDDIIAQPIMESLSGWRISEWHSNYFVLKGTRISLIASGQYKKIINTTMQFSGTADVSSEIDKSSIEITNWDYK